MPKPNRIRSGKTFRPPKSVVTTPKIVKSRPMPKPNRIRSGKTFRPP